MTYRWRHGIFSVVFLAACGQLVAADWPTWRADARRSASTSEQLAEQLYRQWTIRLPELTPAWPEDPRLHFDAVYEPIVMGQTMYIASSINDSVTAINTATGERRWRFYTDGPVRFAPVGAAGRIYFGSDDGCLYCVDATAGTLIWKFSAAPNLRKVIGNERMISVWPVRGGPVIDDGKVYFTVGVWPFEGTFLYVVDSDSGKPVPLTAQGHASPIMLKDRTPQGYLVLSDSSLFIPCGRAAVTALDRKTGATLSYSYRTSAVTNYHVATQGRFLFHGSINYDLQAKATLSSQISQPVLTSDAMYSASSDRLVAFDLTSPETVETKDRRGKTVKSLVLKKLWDTNAKDLLSESALPTIHIKAGSRLYGSSSQRVFAVDVPSEDGTAKLSWSDNLDGTPATMLAADSRLFVVTKEGSIQCFGAEKVTPKIHSDVQESVGQDDRWKRLAERMLAHEPAREGYGLVVGVGSGRLIEELVRQSDLRIIGVDTDHDRIAELRKRLDQMGVYGSRVSLFGGGLKELRLPPYFASLATTEKSEPPDGSVVGLMFQLLRPYGGAAAFELDGDQHQSLVQTVGDSKLPNAEIRRNDGLSFLQRVGALAGSANWTHEYGDPNNSLMSQDQLVKAPLGVLWFGGPAASGDLFYNRHYWGPSMVVLDGRMFVQGPAKLTAIDIYTGRILWMNKLDHNENYNPGRRGNDFEKKLAGFHFLAVEDSLYLVMGKDCLRIDPKTGKTLATLRLPNPDDEWGRIRVQDNVLLAAAFRKSELGHLPRELVALDRHSGKVLWKKEADLSFPFVAVSGHQVFCFDGALDNLYRDWNRKGLVPGAKTKKQLKAIDIQSGKEVWRSETDMVVTWLSYSSEHDVLITSNKSGVVARRGATGEEIWSKKAEGVGFRGHPESVWDKVILWSDLVIDQRGPGFAYDIRTGSPAQRTHPISGEPIDWQFTKAGHHCNYAIANPHLLTFRADSAGFCDIATGNTSRLQGFRSGCRNSLIPAGGVLNSPNFAHGCVCGYSLFTSLALVHSPENEMWSYSALTETGSAVQRVGVNFGAPGDRTSPDGVLWLDWPNVGGSSPGVALKVTGGTRPFSMHSSLIQSRELKWVASSGIDGVTGVRMIVGPKEEPRSYTVRLHFAEPAAQAAGERVFDVELQGERVLSGLDIFKESGGQRRLLVKEFASVEIGKELTIALTARAGVPLICGIEVIGEQPQEK